MAALRWGTRDLHTSWQDDPSPTKRELMLFVGCSMHADAEVSQINQMVACRWASSTAQASQRQWLEPCRWEPPGLFVNRAASCNECGHSQPRA